MFYPLSHLPRPTLVCSLCSSVRGLGLEAKATLTLPPFTHLGRYEVESRAPAGGPDRQSHGSLPSSWMVPWIPLRLACLSPSITPSLCPSGLVEKAPCSGNSSRVCECQPGTFCSTTAVNSCARCSPHSRCSGGEIVKFPGECPHVKTSAAAAAPATGPPPPATVEQTG